MFLGQCCYCFPTHVSIFPPLFPADICIPISESVLSPHISPLDEHNKHPTKEHSWRKSGKMHAKHPLKSKTCSDSINGRKTPQQALPGGWFLSAFSVVLSAPTVARGHNLRVNRVHGCYSRQTMMIMIMMITPSWAYLSVYGRKIQHGEPQYPNI